MGAREIALEIDSRKSKTLGAREIALEQDSRRLRTLGALEIDSRRLRAYVAREFMRTVCSRNRSEDRDRRLRKTLALTTRIDTLIQTVDELETFPPLPPTDRNHSVHRRTRRRDLVVGLPTRSSPVTEAVPRLKIGCSADHAN